MPTYTTPQVVKPERKVEPQAPSHSNPMQCLILKRRGVPERAQNKVGAQDELAQDDIDAVFTATQFAAVHVIWNTQFTPVSLQNYRTNFIKDTTGRHMHRLPA